MSRLVLSLLLAGTSVLAAAQVLAAQQAESSPKASPAPDAAISPGDQTAFYEKAHPYLDDSPSDLERQVPELKGLRTSSGSTPNSESTPAVQNPDPLPRLLDEIGESVAQMIRKIPNLAADEGVKQSQTKSGAQSSSNCGAVYGQTVGGLRSSTCVNGALSQQSQSFDYLILVHQTPNGRVLEEDRTEKQQHPSQKPSLVPNFRGFAESSLVFLPGRRDESRFRYLGEQQIHGRKTFVVAFAQIPGAVRVPGVIRASGGIVPMLLQGIAWVDQENFQIVQLRTDLLAPLPQIPMLTQTAEIRFGPVLIPTLDLTLWLPQVVNVDCEAYGSVYQEEHAYSKYRLYHATIRLFVNPSG